MKIHRYLLPIMILILCLAPAISGATTWAPIEKTDPVSGDKITVRTVASYGSYIYSWSSKYDLIFWPFIDENWIWMNPKSGYAAFGNDFEKLSAAEKKVLAEWLRANYKPQEAPKTHIGKLQWIEKIYGKRQMDEQFWSYFYRVMTYILQENKMDSLAYVKKTLPLLKKKLDTRPEGVQKIECLYLLGEYNRRLGDKPLAKKYFDQAKTQKYIDQDKTEKTGHPYFTELIKNRESLMLGLPPEE
jgi:hypothetical protein